MRRSGSASCILRPKHSLSAEDLQRLAREAPTTTVLTVNRLPPYCTDRLYMLSELQVHANSIRFLCDIDGKSAADAEGSSPPSTPAFPPSIILYLLWKPNTYPTPRSFADGPLSECVRRCLLANGDDAPDDELEAVRASPRKSTYSPRRQRPSLEEELSPRAKELLQAKSDPLGVFGSETKEGGDGSFDAGDGVKSNSSRKVQPEQQKQQLTRIYVVVDRIQSSESHGSLNGVGELPQFPDLSSNSSLEDASESSREGQDGRHQRQQTLEEVPTEEKRAEQKHAQHDNEIKVAEQLARAVASSSFLRNRIDGISVGITSDARAAPGLEACMDAVERGAKERRLAVRNKLVRSAQKKRNNAAGGDDFYAGDESMRHLRRVEQSLERLREGSPERSPVAIVAMQPDDLEGAADHHHDHSHHNHHSDHSNGQAKILQCRVSTEWNGKGECITFVDRAMGDWRRAWCGVTGAIVGDHGRNASMSAIRANSGRRIRPKVPRISAGGREEMDEDDCDADEPISTAMVIVFLAVMAGYVWRTYNDVILDFFFGELLEKD